MAVFSCGDGVVHPMHGAGHIRALETRTVDGVEKQYYCVHLVISDLVIHVPADKEPVGLRPVCSAEEAQRLLKQWPQLPLEDDKYWNKRYRDNMLRIPQRGDGAGGLCSEKPVVPAEEETLVHGREEYAGIGPVDSDFRADAGAGSPL